VKLVRTELKLSQEDLAREQAILGVWSI
jgi:hypothetical protein